MSDSATLGPVVAERYAGSVGWGLLLNLRMVAFEYALLAMIAAGLTDQLKSVLPERRASA